MKTPPAKTLFAVVLLLLLGSSPPAFAADPAISPADAATQRGYVFTLDLIQRYATATKALTAAEARDPSLKAEAGDGSASPDEGIANIKSHPRLYAFFKAQGLSERDSVLLGVAIIEAAFAAGENNLSAFPNVTPAQAAFMKTHDAQLRPILKGVFTSQ